MENNGVNWGEVIDFFSKKYISLRAGLIGSEITVEDNQINVMLKSKSKFMLEQKNANKTISDFLNNTTGKTYNISFIEPEKIDFPVNREEAIIKNIMEENAKRALENINKPKEESKTSKEVPTMKMGFAPSNSQNISNNNNASNNLEQSANNNIPRKRRLYFRPFCGEITDVFLDQIHENKYLYWNKMIFF